MSVGHWWVPLVCELVDALKAAQPDLDALKAEIREAIESVRVRLDVED